MAARSRFARRPAPCLLGPLLQATAAPDWHDCSSWRIAKHGPVQAYRFYRLGHSTPARIFPVPQHRCCAIMIPTSCDLRLPSASVSLLALLLRSLFLGLACPPTLPYLPPSIHLRNLTLFTHTHLSVICLISSKSPLRSRDGPPPRHRGDLSDTR